MSGKYKVTLSPILVEEFKRKVRNELLPGKQIPSGFTNSSQSAQHLWALVCTHRCAHTHTRTPKITLHQTNFFLPSLLHLSSHLLIISLPLLTIIFLQRFSRILPYQPCPFFYPNPQTSTTFWVIK